METIMGVIGDLEQVIRSNVEAGVSPLRGTPLDNSAYAPLLAGVLDAHALMLQAPTVQPTGGSVYVTGKAALFGRDALDVELGFEVVGQDCRFVIRAGLPDLPVLAPLAGAIEAPQLIWSLGPLGEDEEAAALAISRFHLSTALNIGDIRLPVGVYPGTGEDGQWQVEGRGLDLPLPGLEPVFQWLGIAEAASLLPSPLRSLGGFFVTDVSLAFLPGQAALTRARIGLACDSEWKVANSRVAVEDLTFSFGYETDPASGQRAIDTLVYGRLRLGDQSVRVRVRYDASSGAARLEAMADDRLRLPSLQALGDFAGVSLAGLPPQLSELTALALTSFSLEIDTAAKSLVRLAAQIRILDPVEIADGANLESTDFFLELSPRSESPVSGSFDALVSIADDFVPVHADLAEGLEFRGSMEELDLARLAYKLLPDMPKPLENLGCKLHDVFLTCSTSGRFNFEAAVDLDLRHLAKELGVPLPNGLATLVLDRVAIDLDLEADVWSFSLSTPLPTSFPEGSSNHLDVSKIQLEVNRESTGEVSAACRFEIGGAVELSPELKVESEGLECEWKSGSAGYWKIKNAIDVSLFGAPFRFEPELAIEGEVSRFGLRYLGSISLADWPGTASVVAQDVSLGFEKKTDGYQWHCAGEASFDIVDMLSANGTLSLANGRLEVTASVPTPVRIVLPVPVPSPPEVTLTLDTLRLSIGDQGPSIDAEARLIVENAPDFVADFFPPKRQNWRLLASKHEFGVFAEPPESTTIDVIFARDTTLEIDFPPIEISAYGLRRVTKAVGKAFWRLSASLKVREFNRLDRLFGGVELFHETVDLELALGGGLSVVAKTSPLKAWKLRPPKPDGTVWTEWLRIDNVGVFSFRVPEFSFDFAGGRWAAAGGLERDGEISIPLTPLKWVLEQAALPTAFLDAMPNAIPLAEVDLLDEDLYIAHFKRIVEGFDPLVRNALLEMATLLYTGLDGLPDRFCEYLRVSIPQSMQMDVGVEPTGGFSLSIQTDGEPLRLLIPAVLGPVPEMVGITLYGLTAGLSGGGSLMVFRFDGWIDRTDAVSMAYAIATGEGKKLTHRIVMRNTFGVLPMGAPLPIPIFYDELGWEYLDVLGVGVQFHASFKDPQPTLAEWISLVGALRNFIDDESYLLHEHGLPNGMTLPFSMRPTLLRLPNYLGGGALGLEDGLPSVPVEYSLTRALDSIKTGRVGLLIEAIPLRHPGTGALIRLGDKDIQFGPLAISAAWCVSTMKEFQEDILTDEEARQALRGANADAMLACLPEDDGAAAYENGYILLLMGELAAATELHNLFRFRCQFGTAATGPRDSETAVRLSGAFGPEWNQELIIEGRIRTQEIEGRPEKSRVLVIGEVSLAASGKQWSLGSEIEVIPDVSLAARVDFQLTGRLRFTGELAITTTGARLAGELTFMNQVFEASARIGPKGLLFDAISLEFAGVEASARARIPGPNGQPVSLWASLEISDLFTSGFNQSVTDAANKEVSKQIDEAYDRFESYSKQVVDFEASLTGLQSWLPTLCADVLRTIRENTTDEAVVNSMWAWAKDEDDWKIRLLKQSAVEAAIRLGNPGSDARKSAQVWVERLTAAEAAARSPTGSESHRKDVQEALRALISDNEVRVVVTVGSYRFVARRIKNVISADQIKEIKTGIDCIEELPLASRQRMKFREILDGSPREKTLASARGAIARGGLDAPSIKRLGFEAAQGLEGPVELAADVVYDGREFPLRFTARLDQSGHVAAQLAIAFIEAIMPGA